MTQENGCFGLFVFHNSANFEDGDLNIYAHTYSVFICHCHAKNCALGGVSYELLF